MPSLLRTLHKYLSLAFCILWFAQAVTGVALVFRQELDDLLVRGPSRPLQVEALSQGLEALQARHPDMKITAFYPSGGAPGRFDVFMRRADGRKDVFRVDGQGAILRQRPSNYDYAGAGLFQQATVLHQTLFSHQTGRWVIGFSGLLLLSNVIISLRLAWPKGAQAWRALRPRRGKTRAATLFAWHRALGLWMVAPAVVIVAAGTAMAFDDPLEDWITGPQAGPSMQLALNQPKAASLVTAGFAIGLAEHLHPGGGFAALQYPQSGKPWFRVTLRSPAELRRVSGSTLVYVSCLSGRVLLDVDSARLPIRVKFWNSLYAVHTGEAGRLPGRIAAAAVGLALASMIVLGCLLWWNRRFKAGRTTLRRNPSPA